MAADTPVVSVVVPTRDRPELLRRAVTAILSQTYPGPVECLVVFDQSDPDLPWPELPAGRRLVLVRNQRTPGLAGARNSGILAATGELVAFCDDDDEWLPEKLTRQVARLLATPSAAVSTTGILVRYQDRTTTRLAPTELVTHRQLLRSRLTELHPSTVLARRRQLLDDIGLVDEQIPGSYAEDYEWLLRASRHAPVPGYRRGNRIREDRDPYCYTPMHRLLKCQLWELHRARSSTVGSSCTPSCPKVRP